jgi:hypothetical protein
VLVLTGCMIGVEEVKQDPTGPVVARQLVIVDQESGQKYVIPMEPAQASQVGSQLQGNALHVARPGDMPPPINGKPL